MRVLLLLLTFCAPLYSAGADTPQDDRAFTASLNETLLPLRERAATRDAMALARFEKVLPAIMRREKIDMWVIIAREYNEDPVMDTLLPATWLSARRRTMLVFFDPGEGKPLERLAVAKYAIGELFSRSWDEARFPDQYAALADVIKARNPDRIGINTSVHHALADGLSATELRLLKQALPDTYTRRLVSAEQLVIGWLETRMQTEMADYATLTRVGHALIARAFSAAVVTPDVTTTDDIAWWLRAQTTALGLTNWFHPSVSLQRANATKGEDFSSKSGSVVIQPGDLLHVDFGLTYLGLNSDQQQHAYVLRDGETRAPEALRDALATGNRLQDILTGNMTAGRTGNQILALSRKQAIAQGIKPMIYTHPIGYHGHAAGTTIGMWDAQQGVPVQGAYPLHANTAYSIELNAAVDIAVWGGDVRIMLEEQAYFDGDSVRYMDGRQQQLHLIPSDEP